MDVIDLTGFRCLNCGACCRQRGYVRLQKNEADRIAEYLGMKVRLFIDRHTRLTRDRQNLSLNETSTGECVFLTPAGCLIHPVKPRQCRDFPVQWRFKEFETICAWAKTS